MSSRSPRLSTIWTNCISGSCRAGGLERRPATGCPSQCCARSPPSGSLVFSLHVSPSTPRLQPCGMPAGGHFPFPNTVAREKTTSPVAARMSRGGMARQRQASAYRLCAAARSIRQCTIHAPGANAAAKRPAWPRRHADPRQQPHDPHFTIPSALSRTVVDSMQGAATSCATAFKLTLIATGASVRRFAHAASAAGFAVWLQMLTGGGERGRGSRLQPLFAYGYVRHLSARQGRVAAMGRAFCPHPGPPALHASRTRCHPRVAARYDAEPTEAMKDS